MAETTTRAYTLKLSGDGDWRKALWQTHLTVNRGAQAWGDWLLTLRGGLPASLGDEDANRRVLLALSWLSVESPASLVPREHIVAAGTDPADQRAVKVMNRFRDIVSRMAIVKSAEWLKACEPALTARIRDDAVWVDRSTCFAELQRRYPGLNSEWAANTLFHFLGAADEYFTMPDAEKAAPAEARDFVQKAGGWLSRNWGSGKKSNSLAIGTMLIRLAGVESSRVINQPGRQALFTLLKSVGQLPDVDASADELFTQLKQAVGWKGRPSKGAIALGKVRDADTVSSELWQRTLEKLSEESNEQTSKSQHATDRPDWMPAWRAEMESRLGMPYRVGKDLIWEQGVTLDHALRRVSAAHTWIKRAEGERHRFREDTAKIDEVSPAARAWLDNFRDTRSSATGALGDYIIRKRAIDGWDKVVQAWAALGDSCTRKQRIDAARAIQANLDDNDKFGDIQLFAGFGDEDDDNPQTCLADDNAVCVWRQDDGRADAEILKRYVAATVAEHDQRRFKVPAYRHPDPLRHPVYVDFGNSRWGINYSAMDASQVRQRLAGKLSQAKTNQTRTKIQQQLDSAPDLHGVTLDVWNGERVESLPLRWHGRRLWSDLDLAHFGKPQRATTVSRADRLGRVAAGQTPKAPVNIAEVFQQKEWNGRLQVPREQLDRLADIVYGKIDGKRVDPDYAKLDGLCNDARARKQWNRLKWFLTTSAKLQPHGPWLDYEAAGLPAGIQYKKGRNGYYLDYSVNKGRKGRARLQLARLPGLRILSLDLGHRYAAACAVWETITRQQMIDACRAAGHAEPTGDENYIHLRRATRKVQKSGRNKGKPVTETTIYRRIGADMLDGSEHPAPWARLERQFLIKLQGEDRRARRAHQNEIDFVNEFRMFLGMAPMAEVPLVDDLQKESVRLARLGLRRLGDAARIAFAMTATRKPISGGRESDSFIPQQRVAYLQDTLVLWQELASSRSYKDEWSKQLWHAWVVQRFGGPQPVEITDDVPRSERKKRIEATRGPLLSVAEQLADSKCDAACQLHRLWADEWRRREAEWRSRLRRLRRFILPRKNDCEKNAKAIRQVGGLSMKRLKTIRDLHQVLKAFRMRPEPDDLRKNIPALGDESLANFGRRILNQLERLREQRIKQLASRIVEAALGVGRMQKSGGRDCRRPESRVDRPCQAVVVENLEHYRPEDSRLRRENRQLMEWAARNVRKSIMEGCELYGLHFVEVPPAYTSRQDSRTGAPGVRCEDVSTEVLRTAAERVHARDSCPSESEHSTAPTSFEREVRYWARELNRVKKTSGDLSPRDRVLRAFADGNILIPAGRCTIRLPRRGGELFVSTAADSPTAAGVQADLNAAANIGLRAVTDPDWVGAWWFVLVNLASGKPTKEKVQGCTVWESPRQIWPPVTAAVGGPATRKAKTDIYAWNPRFRATSQQDNWLATQPYWEAVERQVSEELQRTQFEPENPF